MYTIGELVRLDEHISEQSVVQIDFYTQHDRNLSLLKNFVFARSAPEGMDSSLGILNRLREVSLTEARENVFCIIANYGQGKSHFGLVLANYFGRDVDSIEFSVVMDKIEHAEGDEVRVRNLREFREARKPYFVIRLRGDSPLPLNQQFLQAMQNALQEAGIDGKLPLWYQKAADWLERFPERGWEEQANEFLQRYGIDLPALIVRVREFDADTYDIVNELHKQLVGTYPHFEGDLEPRDLLLWLMDVHCNEEKRFGGVLILFDEFSQFVERYYARRSSAGSLQRLLETVDSLRPHVLFVAFAQYDPSQIVRHDTPNVSKEQMDEALRELQRLPEHNKLRLYTRMELVIDGYLRQEDAPFRELLNQDQRLDDMLWDAGVRAREAFIRRYSEQQQWTSEQFYEIVCKGCFPLHPMTTTILCKGFRTETTQVDTPRTVLGFVQERVQRKRGEPFVAPKGKLNWIYPVELVDYFLDMIPQRETDQYRTALKRIRESPSSAGQIAVLKAVLIISVAGLTTRKDNFVKIVSDLSGLDDSEVKKALKDLEEELILYNDQGIYRFYSLGGDPYLLQQLYYQKWSEPISEKDVKLLNGLIPDTLLVNVTWGHPDDWQARQVIWLISQFTEQNLKREAPLLGDDIDQYRRVRRGLVVRLLALSDNEMDGLEEHVSHILDQTFSDENAPAILVVLPSKSMPDLICCLRWKEFLEVGISHAESQRIGIELIQGELQRVSGIIEQDKSRLLEDRVSLSNAGELRWIVPKAYRVAFRKEKPQTLMDALRHLYAQVYRHAPPFFDQYNHESKQLRKDVVQICCMLAEDRLYDIVSTFGKRPGPGKDCVDKYLLTQWRILRSDYRIQDPHNYSNVKPAWEELERAFSSKEVAVPVREVLLRLLNPPYGYHFHQLALLFSAWYGYNRNQIELSIDGRLDKLPSIWDLPKMDRSEQFIGYLLQNKSNVAIKRRDTNRELEQVKELVRKILSRSEYVNQHEAEEALSKLNKALELEIAEESLLKDIQHGIEILENDMSIAKEYDRRAEQLLSNAYKETRLQKLVDSYCSPPLPEIGIVEPRQPSLQVISSRMMERICEIVEKTCRDAEQIKNLEDVSKYRESLRETLGEVRRTGRQELESRVQRALRLFEQNAKDLEIEYLERGVIDVLQAMDLRAPLDVLRNNLKKLESYNPRSEKTREKLQAKRAEIEQAIQQSVERIHKWEQNFQQASDKSSLEHLMDEVRKYWMHYHHSPEMKQLEHLEKDCKRFLDLINQASEIGNFSPHNPVEVSEATRKLERILSQGEHSAVRSEVVQAKQRLEEYAHKKEEEALDWLQGIEQDLETKQAQELYLLIQQLDDPPAFLPPSENNRLSALKERVQKRLDKHTFESVLQLLLQIRDAQILRQIQIKIEMLLSDLDRGSV